MQKGSFFFMWPLPSERTVITIPRAVLEAGTPRTRRPPQGASEFAGQERTLPGDIPDAPARPRVHRRRPGVHRCLPWALPQNPTTFAVRDPGFVNVRDARRTLKPFCENFGDVYL